MEAEADLPVVTAAGRAAQMDLAEGVDPVAQTETAGAAGAAAMAVIR